MEIRRLFVCRHGVSHDRERPRGYFGLEPWKDRVHVFQIIHVVELVFTRIIDGH
jgi:hypothetical protein